MKLATVFSGIGAIEQALYKLNINYDIVFACDTGERYIDVDLNKVKKELSKLNEEDKIKYIRNLYDATKKT